MFPPTRSEDWCKQLIPISKIHNIQLIWNLIHGIARKRAFLHNSIWSTAFKASSDYLTHLGGILDFQYLDSTYKSCNFSFMVIELSIL